MRQKSKRILIAGGGLFAVTVIAGTLYLTRVTQIFLEKTYELGQAAISQNASDYIEAKPFMIDRAILDTSAVCPDRVGDYLVTCDVGRKQFEYRIRIVDTTPPKIEDLSNKCNFGTDLEYDIDDVAVVYDRSEISRFQIVGCEPEREIETDQESESELESETNQMIESDQERELADIWLSDTRFCIDMPGDYSISLEAEDIYGNTSTLSVKITILEAPHFVMLSDRQFKVGTHFTPTDFVYASDKDGLDISERIEVVDDSDYDSEIPGEYGISYRVIDDRGIERKQSIRITIGEDYDLGFAGTGEDLQILIDHDYFRYEPLDHNEDHDAVLELTSPSSFSVKFYAGHMRGAASCYLYKVTPQKVYFITNKHCKEVLTAGSSFELYDYEDEYLTLSRDVVEYIQHDKRDIMLFSVPAGEIPTELLLKYKEALIDWNIYEKTAEGDKLLLNTQCWNVPKDRVFHDEISDLTLESLSRDTLAEEPLDYPVVSTREHELKAGRSGSPLFDYNGYLIGTAESIYLNTGTGERVDAFVRLDDLYEITQMIQ